MERDRHRQRDHMEFHSFIFSLTNVFLKLTHVVFITPDSSKQLVCGVDSLDFCLLWACVRVSLHMWTWALCLGFSYLCLCECVCESNLNAFRHSVYGLCSVRSVCKSQCYTLSSHVQLK